MSETSKETNLCTENNFFNWGAEMYIHRIWENKFFFYLILLLEEILGPKNDPMESSKIVLELPLTLPVLEDWNLGFDKGLLKKKSYM